MFQKIAEFLKNLIVRTKKFLLKDFDLKKTLISCSVVFCAFALVFPAGAVSSKTVDEVCADYCAEIAKNHTYNVSEKKLSGLVVEPKKDSKNKMRHDTDNAVTELWGVFKGTNASFAPVMNANKNNDIHFDDTEFTGENLSFVYSNIGQSTEAYHTVKDKNGGEPKIIDYKFQSSPIALMFPSANSGMQDKLHIYISLKQAENKLKEQKQEISEENLKSLLNIDTVIKINGFDCNCIIDNIYLDNFDHEYKLANYDYYYATDIGNILGDFVFVILYALKPNVFPDSLTRQSLYVMSEYSYRNKYYLKYAKESYSPDEYDFDYARANINDGFIPDRSILENSLNTKRNDTLCSLMTVLFIIIFCANLVLIYLFQLYLQPLSIVLMSIASSIPYLIFKLIYVFTINTYLFSSYSLMFELILFTIMAIVIVLLNCFNREVILEKEHA